MDYQSMIEEKFGKSLKEVMYEVCVDKRMEKWEGAEFLNVPLETFVKWRSKYRFGPIQIQVDQAEKRRKETIGNYKAELNEINLARTFEHQGRHSIEAFKEIIQRTLELEKYSRTIQEATSMSDLAITLKIGILESTLESLEQFKSGQIYEDYNNRLKFLEQKSEVL